MNLFRYGRFNTVKQLLDSEKGSFIINETDGEGLTPLHIASQQGRFLFIFCIKYNRLIFKWFAKRINFTILTIKHLKITWFCRTTIPRKE